MQESKKTQVHTKRWREDTWDGRLLLVKSDVDERRSALNALVKGGGDLNVKHVRKSFCTEKCGSNVSPLWVYGGK